MTSAGSLAAWSMHSAPVWLAAEKAFGRTERAGSKEATGDCSQLSAESKEQEIP